MHRKRKQIGIRSLVQSLMLIIIFLLECFIIIIYVSSMFYVFTAITLYNNYVILHYRPTNTLYLTFHYFFFLRLIEDCSIRHILAASTLGPI